ncbi:hypothetical protein [Marinifilum sp. D714]|uniref:hypothetical protein n=1 Tax=Marinifilum sp. D714 TaxID=2937523 RepID=UPI0027CBD7BB|nr:hypothetical protein [Marinifilum sp. D714]MDQ2178179.1 hypothetical protein [Marinifilum sp. D714]
MKKLRYILFGFILLMIYSCGGGSDSDDGGMMPNPDPDPDPMIDFTVRTVTKTSNHPWFNQGSTIGYTINGNEGSQLNLTRGTKYVFDINTPTHPFYISTDDTGVGAGEVSNGVTGSKTQTGTLSFTPNSNHPDTLYYQCSAHPKMGYLIILSDS